MIPLTALRQAAGALLGDGAPLGPSVPFGAEPLRGVSAGTTALAGADAAAASDPHVRRWIGGVTGWLLGHPHGADAPAVRHADLALWPLLGEPGGVFDTGSLIGAVPDGAAWIVALDPPRFFTDAAELLERHGTDRGARLAARLRSPAGNLALVGKMVDTVAISLEEDGAGLRLRVGCADGAASRQALLVLQGWRVRRAMGEGPGAALFHDATVTRVGHRVEVAFRGEPAAIGRLFAAA